jgi:DNA-damage-inducible protein D
MSSQLPTPAASNTFERIKRINAESQESWSARDLARVLEYLNFRNFQPVIEKAKEACTKSGHAVADHFAEIRNMVGIGSGAQREVEDWMLSRYACYLVIQNADPSKPLVALGQSYFAVQTRRQEMADDEALKEDNTRLLLRAEMKKHNKNLAGVAKQAGVVQPVDYAIFMDHGYRGLYGGLGMRDVRARKRLKPKEHLLDHMGSTTQIRPTGFTAKWDARSVEQFMNWAARCRKIYRWPRVSKKSRAGKRSGSRLSKRNR